MQSVCLKEAEAIGPLAEQTTLVGMTFGGHLRSKVFPVLSRNIYIYIYCLGIDFIVLLMLVKKH